MPEKRERRHFKPPWLVLSATVGVGAGLGAVVLIRSIALVEGAAGVVQDAVGRGGFLLTIPAGLALSAWLTARFAPEVAGHGVPRIIESITVSGGRIRTRVAPLKIIATALTIGAGGSVGREGSIAQIGSTIGSWLGRVLRMSENDVRILVAAGAGAGISATFNAPIAGMLFAFEVILAEFSVWSLHTVVVASVAGAVVSHGLLGEELTFRVTPYRLEDPAQLILYGLLALAVVTVGILFMYLLDAFESPRFPIQGWQRPIAFGLVVAGLVWVFPELTGTGQQVAARLLRGEVDSALWLVFLLAPLKAVTSSATLGGRGAGGIFMPSLFMGAALGAALAQLLDPVWGLSTIQPGAFALVGMAAAFAAVARAPLTSILIVFETTGDYGLVLPLMIATSIATFLASRFHPESAYTSPLLRMGIHPTRRGSVDLLDTITVGEVAGYDFPSIDPDAPLEEAAAVMERERSHGIPVVEGDRLVGIVSETDVRRVEDRDHATVADAMTRDPVTVTQATRVSEALARMAALGVGRLPVVDAEMPDRLIGMFRRADAVAAYHQALGSAVRARRPPGLLRAVTGTDVSTFETEVPPGSVADGRRIREVQWPDGCLVVAVHRGPTVLLAGGDTELRAHDVLTMAGTPDAQSRLAERLRRGPDDTAEPMV